MGARHRGMNITDSSTPLCLPGPQGIGWRLGSTYPLPSRKCPRFHIHRVQDPGKCRGSSCHQAQNPVFTCLRQRTEKGRSCRFHTEAANQGCVGCYPKSTPVPLKPYPAWLRGSPKSFTTKGEPEAWLSFLKGSNMKSSLI